MKSLIETKDSRSIYPTVSEDLTMFLLYRFQFSALTEESVLGKAEQRK